MADVARTDIGDQRAEPRGAKRVRRWSTVAAAAGLGGMFLLPTATAAEAAGTGHAQTRAKQDLLRLSDLPKGWKLSGAPHPGTKSTSQLSKAASCEGISAKGVDANPPNEGEAFSAHGGAQYVVESVAVFPSAAVAGRTYRLFSNAKAEACLSPTLIRSLAGTPTAKGTAAKATTSPLSLSRVGAAATGFVVHVPVNSGGRTVTLVGDVITIRSGNVIAILSPIYAAKSLTAAFVRSLAKRAASRLR